MTSVHRVTYARTQEEYAKEKSVYVCSVKQVSAFSMNASKSLLSCQRRNHIPTKISILVFSLYLKHQKNINENNERVNKNK